MRCSPVFAPKLLSCVVIAAALQSGCGFLDSIFQSTEARCTDKLVCQAGTVCDQASGKCVAEPDMSVELDMSTPDLTDPPDLAMVDLYMPDLVMPDLLPECTSEAGCTPGLACVSQRCQPCVLHDDCESKVCDVYQTVGAAVGRCLGKDNIVYVDNKNGGACASGDGTMGSPVCTLAEGVPKLGVAKPSMRVVASTKEYATPQFNGTTAVLYGPAGQGGKAQLSNVAGIALQVTGNGSVTADGFELVKSTTGVSCTGGGTTAIKLRRLTIDGTATGLSVNDCQLDLDRGLIQNTTVLALSLLGSKAYSITNTFIVKNVGAAATVNFANSSAGKFQFNTVADNSGAGAAFSCMAAMPIDDSIVVGNGTTGTTQFFGTCNVGAASVVGVGDTVTGGVKQTPEFKTAGGVSYGIDTNGTSSKAYVIDKAAGMIGFDYFGTRRPKGGGYDVGAHEAN